MRTRDCALTLDFVGESLKLAGNVVLDRSLLDGPEEIESRRYAPEIVEPYARAGRRQRIGAR